VTKEQLMDSADFDQLARSLATQVSRRRILAGALSAALGLLMPPAGGSLVRADRKHRQPCAKDGQKAQPKKGCCTGLIEDADGRCTTGPPSNPCEGQADGTCCAGDTGQQWCQGGSCVAVPDYGTITQCRGACQFRGEERVVTVCGATMTCPGCDECGRACNHTACDGIIGAFDTGGYCVRGTDAVCTNGGCTPPAQCCTATAIGCVEVCVP
jgi:hypothetical protein